jgi:hypothetical protein
MAKKRDTQQVASAAAEAVGDIKRSLGNKREANFSSAVGSLRKMPAKHLALVTPVLARLTAKPTAETQMKLTICLGAMTQALEPRLGLRTTFLNTHGPALLPARSLSSAAAGGGPEPGERGRRSAGPASRPLLSAFSPLLFFLMTIV